MTSFNNILPIALAAVSLAGFHPVQAYAQDAEEEKASSRDWIDTLDWNGDLRLRYEGIDEAGEVKRNRFRFRGRFGFASELSNKVQFAVRLATSDGNPVSTNLDFGNGFSSKDIAIDRVFINWNALINLDIALGKMGRPWFRAGSNSLIWDSDLNPEGVHAQWASGMFFVNLGTFVVDERSESDDSLLYSVQAGLDKRFSESSRLIFSAAYFDYTNTIGNPPFYRDQAKGNSVDAAGNFLHDYDIVEISAEYLTVVNDWPVSAYGVWAQNTAVDIQDTAFAVGVRVGLIDAAGKMQFSYTWHDTEADAVMGIFTDSDFGGGSTDSKGHFIKARYGLTGNIALNGTLILSEIEMFRNNRHDYDRVQLDIEFFFD
ncbi:MAG: putative porin [Proteobacteria bacterium]|nr:putative porin [Pseudomonadota bacterium]